MTDERKTMTDERKTYLLKKWGKILDVSSDRVKPIEESNLNLNNAILIEPQECWPIEKQKI